MKTCFKFLKKCNIENAIKCVGEQHKLETHGLSLTSGSIASLHSTLGQLPFSVTPLIYKIDAQITVSTLKGCDD